MPLLRLICSNGFQLDSVKSKHHTAHLCPCTALSFPALISGHRPVCHFQAKQTAPAWGPSPAVPRMDCSALEFCRNSSFSHPFVWAHNLKGPSPIRAAPSQLSIPFSCSSLIATGNWPVHWLICILILSPYFSMCHHACLCSPEDRIMLDVTRGTEKQWIQQWQRGLAASLYSLVVQCVDFPVVVPGHSQKGTSYFSYWMFSVMMVLRLQ